MALHAHADKHALGARDVPEIDEYYVSTVGVRSGSPPKIQVSVVLKNKL